MFKEIRSSYHKHGGRVLMPTLWAVCNYRFGRWGLTIRISPVRWLILKIHGFFQFFILLSSGIQLSINAEIGEGLHLIHPGNILIYPGVKIGDRCGILHDVTIGPDYDATGKSEFMVIGKGPNIGNDVFIGAGAKIFGNITIGDNASIAANSLIKKDIPPKSLAIGVPAEIIHYSGKKKNKTGDKASLSKDRYSDHRVKRPKAQPEK